jgi:hypothetical protein
MPLAKMNPLIKPIPEGEEGDIMRLILSVMQQSESQSQRTYTVLTFPAVPATDIQAPPSPARPAPRSP